MGLGCDEQLEPPVDKSPFKPLEPLSVLPEMGPDSPDLLHLSGRRPQASAPTYPSAALAQRILGERSEPAALSELPAEVKHRPPLCRACAGSQSCAGVLQACNSHQLLLQHGSSDGSALYVFKSVALHVSSGNCISSFTYIKVACCVSAVMTMHHHNVSSLRGAGCASLCTPASGTVMDTQSEQETCVGTGPHAASHGRARWR